MRKLKYFMTKEKPIICFFLISQLSSLSHRHTFIRSTLKAPVNEAEKFLIASWTPAAQK